MHISHHPRNFEHTVRAYSADLYRYAYWLCRDRHLAEDIVQESFARAWKAWSELRDFAQAKAWLMTILRNEFMRSFSRNHDDDELIKVAEYDLPARLSFEEEIDLAHSRR